MKKKRINFWNFFRNVKNTIQKYKLVGKKWQIKYHINIIYTIIILDFNELIIDISKYKDIYEYFNTFNLDNDSKFSNECWS